MARSFQRAFVIAFLGLLGSGCAALQGQNSVTVDFSEHEHARVSCAHYADGTVKRQMVERYATEGSCSIVDREVYHYDESGALRSVRYEHDRCGVPTMRADYSDCVGNICRFEQDLDRDADGEFDVIATDGSVAAPPVPTALLAQQRHSALH